MGLNWFLIHNLHNSYIHYLQLFKYNLKWDFSWNGQISTKNKKIGKKLQNLYSIAEHISLSDILYENL